MTGLFPDRSTPLVQSHLDRVRMLRTAHERVQIAHTRINLTRKQIMRSRHCIDESRQALDALSAAISLLDRVQAGAFNPAVSPSPLHDSPGSGGEHLIDWDATLPQRPPLLCQ